MFEICICFFWVSKLTQVSLNFLPLKKKTQVSELLQIEYYLDNNFEAHC